MAGGFQHPTVLRGTVVNPDMLLLPNLIWVVGFPEDGEFPVGLIQLKLSGSEAVVIGVVHELRQLQNGSVFKRVVLSDQDVVHPGVFVFAVDFDCGFVEDHRQQVIGECIAGAEENGEQCQE